MTKNGSLKFSSYTSSDKNKIDQYIHLRNTNISYNIKIRTFSNFHCIVTDIYDNSHRGSGLPYLKLTLIAAKRIFEMSLLFVYFSMLNYFAFFFLPGPEQVPSLTMLRKSFLRTYVRNIILCTYSWYLLLKDLPFSNHDQGC